MRGCLHRLVGMLVLSCFCSHFGSVMGDQASSFSIIDDKLGKNRLFVRRLSSTQSDRSASPGYESEGHSDSGSATPCSLEECNVIFRIWKSNHIDLDKEHCNGVIDTIVVDDTKGKPTEVEGWTGIEFLDGDRVLIVGGDRGEGLVFLSTPGHHKPKWVVRLHPETTAVYINAYDGESKTLTLRKWTHSDPERKNAKLDELLMAGVMHFGSHEVAKEDITPPVSEIQVGKRTTTDFSHIVFGGASVMVTNAQGQYLDARDGISWTSHPVDVKPVSYKSNEDNTVGTLKVASLLPPNKQPPPASRDERVQKWMRTRADLDRERCNGVIDTIVVDRADWYVKSGKVENWKSLQFLGADRVVIRGYDDKSRHTVFLSTPNTLQGFEWTERMQPETVAVYVRMYDGETKTLHIRHWTDTDPEVKNAKLDALLIAGVGNFGFHEAPKIELKPPKTPLVSTIKVGKMSTREFANIEFGGVPDLTIRNDKGQFLDASNGGISWVNERVDVRAVAYEINASGNYGTLTVTSA